jgi:hypothetical protein
MAGLRSVPEKQSPLKLTLSGLAINNPGDFLLSDAIGRQYHRELEDHRGSLIHTQLSPQGDNIGGKNIFRRSGRMVFI